MGRRGCTLSPSPRSGQQTPSPSIHHLAEYLHLPAPEMFSTLPTASNRPHPAPMGAVHLFQAAVGSSPREPQQGGPRAGSLLLR